jgi:hypothetical protein
MKVDREGVLCGETGSDPVSAEDLNRRIGAVAGAYGPTGKDSSFGCA